MPTRVLSQRKKKVNRPSKTKLAPGATGVMPPEFGIGDVVEWSDKILGKKATANITEIKRWTLDRYRYRIAFHKPLYEKCYIEKILSLSVGAESLKLIKKAQ